MWAYVLERDKMEHKKLPDGTESSKHCITHKQKQTEPVLHSEWLWNLLVSPREGYKGNEMPNSMALPLVC